MERKGLGKEYSLLAARVKMASNISTVLFMIFMAYTIGYWHKAIGIDNFINVLVLILIIGVNTRFYQIYINIGTFEYKKEKQDFLQMVRLSFTMTLLILLLKLI